MSSNKVRELWRAGQPVVAGWCSTADTFTAEVMVRAGFDALVLDMQHGMGIGPDRAATWLQVVGQSDATPFIRIPWNEPTYAQWVLDAGAMGLIVPMVNNVEEAKKAIAACRYPPLGYRSCGPNRVRLSGGPNYIERANDEVICLVQMETVEGIENIEEIAKLPGLDGYFIGPADLALSMGLPGEMDCKAPQHVAAVQRVIDVARAHGQQSGIFVTGPEEAARRWEQGFNLNPAVADIRLFTAAVNRAVADFRQRIGR